MKTFFSIIVLLATNTTVVLSQKCLIKCDTMNFEFNTDPYFSTINNLFDEAPIANNLGSDRYKTFPLKRNGSHFEYDLAIRKPVFITLVNAVVLALPGQEVYGILDKGQYLDVKDSNSINYFFTELKKKILLIRLQINKDQALPEFLLLYDSMKTCINEQLKFISLQESRQRYNVDFWAISYLKHYFMAELGNVLFTPTWLKKDFDMTLYKKYREDIHITDPKILLEFQTGTMFLQRHFFHYALPENNYDLVKTLSTDNFFRDVEVKKYLGYRYFSHLYTNKPILERVKNFDTAFSVFKTSYTFSNDEKLSLKQLQSRLKETRSTMLSSILNEEIVKPGGTVISRNDKSQIFGGNKLLYVWASWCGPCKEYLSSLRSNKFKYNGKQYTMIFVSIDSDITKWEKTKYAVFNALNSFKIGKPATSDLLNNYELRSVVPKVLLLEDGRLSEIDVDKDQLIQQR